MGSDEREPFDYTVALRRAAWPAEGRVNKRFLSVIEKSPFLLNVETVSICNAKCCFCPYTKMRRKRGYMPLDLYRKILAEYSELGGGALLLTPILGEYFLDKFWKERVDMAREFSNIGAISLTTNAIAVDRLCEQDLLEFLSRIDYIQISVGGVNRADYLEMFGVDRFERVRANIKRLTECARRVRSDFPVRIIFRTNRTEDELRAFGGFEEFRALGTEIVIDNSFANWGGEIDDVNLPAGTVMRSQIPLSRKESPCFMLYLGLYVTSSGIATACGCMDGGALLKVGDCTTQHLREIWRGEPWKELFDSFSKGSPPALCQKCNFYQDGKAFIASPKVMSFEERRFPFGY